MEYVASLISLIAVFVSIVSVVMSIRTRHQQNQFRVHLDVVMDEMRALDRLIEEHNSKTDGESAT